MKITWLGHSAFRLDMKGASLLIDPFITGNPACRTSVAEASKGVTHVALTHGHDDHLGDTAAICKATGATLIAVWEIVAHLGGQGVDKAEPTNTGGTIRAGVFDISFVRADHSSSSGGVYLGNPCGLIVRETATGKTVYHMGDTDIFGDMALIAEIHQPRIGLVPIGDRFTMGAATAALACRRFFRFDTVIPCHYATFGMLDPTADKFVAGMAGSKTKVAVPKSGGTVEL